MNRYVVESSAALIHLTMRMGRVICPFFIMKIYILKPHQHNGVWFHVGLGYEVEDLRARDLIEAGLASADNPLAITLKPRIATQEKPRIATQAKPRQTASTKTIVVVEPIKPDANKVGGQQGDPNADLIEQHTDPKTDNGATGGQQNPIDTTGSDNTNNDQG